MSKAYENVIKLNAWVTPQDYGAIGDGVADDTTSIQAALSASKAIDFGGPNYIYKVTATLFPQTSSYLHGSGATIKQTTNIRSIFNLTNRTDVVIEGLRFEDTAAGYATNDGNPHAPVFSNAGSARVTVQNCTFTQVTYAAIYFAGASSVNVSNNTIKGPGAPTIPASTNLRCYGVLFDVGCKDLVCSGNDISATLHGIRIERSVQGVANNNTIHDISGQHGFYIGAACVNWTICGNNVFNIALQGIKIQAENAFADVSNITVTGNSVLDCGDHGITLSTGSLIDPPGSPQTKKCRNIIIAGNTVGDVVGSALSCNNAVQCVLADNVLFSCGFSGVAVSACDHFDIRGNKISETQLSGIRDAFACSYVTVSDNTLHNVAKANTAGDRFGIFFQALDYHAIKRNRVTSSAGGMQHALRLDGGTQTTSSVEDNELLGAYEFALMNASSSASYAGYRNNNLSGTLGASTNNPTLPVVASAATLTLPTNQRIVRITGTTGITSINISGQSCNVITLVFDDALTVTDGGNLILAGNFVTTANDVLTLLCDGSNWFEVSRSVN